MLELTWRQRHDIWTSYSLYLVLLFGNIILAFVTLVKVFKNHSQYSDFNSYDGIWIPTYEADYPDIAYLWEPSFDSADLENWACSFARDFNGTFTGPGHSLFEKYCPIIEAGRYILIPYFITSILAFAIAYMGLKSLALDQAKPVNVGYNGGKDNDWEDTESMSNSCKIRGIR